MSTLVQPARKLPVASIDRGILRAALAVSAAGIAVKIVASSKEIAVASIYGRSDAMDAFLMAALIPGLLINLISESMSQALQPMLIRVRELEGQERAQQLLSNAMVCMCFLLAAVSAVMAVCEHSFFPLLASHFPVDKLALTERMFLALLPVVLITGVATNCTGVLNSLDRFALPALAPVVIPMAIVAGAWLLSARMGIWAMVCATLAGALLHATAVVGMMSRYGYCFRLRWHGMTDATREVARQYGPVLLSGVVASGGVVVDQCMAAMLPAGSVSALVYANRFVAVVLTLMAGAISTAVSPYFSRIIAQRDWAGCRHVLRTWVWLSALVSAPAAVALMAGSHLLIRVTLQHGAFGVRDTAVVARVLSMYAIQIPFFVSSRVFYRFLIAMRRTGSIFFCGAINLILDIVLNLILMRWLGIAGIALATSLWTVSTFLLLGYWSRKLLLHAACDR
jgi:putative peptidoglycan lipid II flippase